MELQELTLPKVDRFTENNAHTPGDQAETQDTEADLDTALEDYDKEQRAAVMATFHATLDKNFDGHADY